jgi:aspartate kinase
MGIIVQKYGGSSVADIDKMARVADKVVATRRAGHDVVVTVSAMGKSTDNLLALARSAAMLDGVQHDPPRRELDMLLSTGERVSMSLLSIAIQARGEQAISFTGSQSGIITNDRHFDARIIEVRPHRVEDELSRGKIVIVAGYQGMSYRRDITTLGRGGSDTTAVALAAALGAEQCEIYSDVDGVYSADPRVVAEARHLPELDHAVLQEMAECGAKVLNAQAVEWARKAGVRIHARSTFDAWEDAAKQPRQTVAASGREAPKTSVRAIVGENNLVLGTVGGSAQHLEDLARCSRERELPIKDLDVGADRTTFVLPLLNVPDWTASRRMLEGALGSGGLALREGLAAVSVVGDGLSTTGAPLLHFLEALRDVGIVPIRLTGNALRLTAVLEQAQLADAQRALHAVFVEADPR